MAALAKQEAREEGKMLTEIAEGWGRSTWSSWVKGRSVIGVIACQSGEHRQTVLVVVEATLQIALR